MEDLTRRIQDISSRPYNVRNVLYDKMTQVFPPRWGVIKEVSLQSVWVELATYVRFPDAQSYDVPKLVTRIWNSDKKDTLERLLDETHETIHRP